MCVYMLQSFVSCSAQQPKDSTEVNTSSNKKVVRVIRESGIASYYADKFNGRKTASGTKFDNKKKTAAHRTLAFGTLLRITNLENGKTVEVEVTDRGPHSKSKEIDLTKKAFMEIAGNKKSGHVKVKIEEIE